MERAASIAVVERIAAEDASAGCARSWRAHDDVDLAEPPRIGEPQLARRPSIEHHVRVLRRAAALVVEPQPARHPEVDEHATLGPIGVDEQVLADAGARR